MKIYQAKLFARRVWQLVTRSFRQGAKLNRLYDECTLQIMAKVLSRDSCGVDVGCHKGMFLKSMLALAPEGCHYAFEPIPALAANLRKHFPGVSVHEIALSDSEGTATFRHVLSRPAYSGLQERDYPEKKQMIDLIEVKTATLDSIVPADQKIDFVKVDVEGGEFGVFLGAKKTITTHKPHIVFEHGKGAAPHYGTTPQMVFDLLVGELGLSISLLPAWLATEPPLTRDEFIRQFEDQTNYYFLAHP